MQAIRLRAFNNTHRENLVQYKNLKNKILAAFDIFGVFTQFKFSNSIKGVRKIAPKENCPPVRFRV